MKFEIKHHDAAGRIGRLITKHGSVTTPLLLPVINPNKMSITPQRMKEKFGVQAVITNSYIIHQHQKLHETALAEGVHSLIDFDGPIMTDSGTFQSYMYGEIEMDPLTIVRFQRDIGSDIGTILDIFGTPDQTKEEAEDAVNITVERAKQSIPEKKEMNLACPVQGSIYPSLRSYCAKKLGELDADMHPIGGVVPLMENQQYTHLVKVILASKKGLPVNRPVHLFGAGHPLIFPLAAALGCDIFDSSAYIKYAKQNRLIFPWGTEKIDDLYDLPCSCPVCSTNSLSELRSLPKKKREQKIAEHNLFISMSELKKVRNAIMQGRLWELVEKQASANPFLQDALHEIHNMNHIDWLEQFEPVRKTRGLFYTGIHTIHQPFFYRLQTRLIQWFNQSSSTLVVLDETEKPFSTAYADILFRIAKEYPKESIIVDSAIGPIPIDLDEMYPFAQYIFPDFLDAGTKQIRKKRWEECVGDKNIIRWETEGITSHLTPNEEDHLQKIFDERKVRAVAQMQFGLDIAPILLNGVLSLVKSKKTSKIRNVFVDGAHVVSMRASDGLFTLKLNGGKKIHKYSSSPRFRVVIDDDAVPFVKEGKSVFSKFVSSVDSRLRPYDECIVVSKKDEILAIGQCLISPCEMGRFRFGQAVKIREHID
ncbi:MAG TPA: tRNA guanosine(15) transglycosylase TgtA [Candidatus Thermoplasmatota archaeon]|nr:tRNA guanosine(15) transglycosylase TgtA [Candidatus Thermoplasmatota archaeon]